MKNKIVSILQLFLCLTVLYGCSKQMNTNDSKLEKQFATAIPVADMNKSLKLIVDSKKQYFSLDSEIPLIVENKSSYFISFDQNAFIKLLINKDNQWVEIENSNTYSGTILVSPRSKPGLNLQTIAVKPILDDKNLIGRDTTIPLRIVIIGQITNNNLPTGEKVGTYVDVLLSATEQAIKSTDEIIYSIDETIKGNHGKIEGIITSAEELGKPLSDVTIDLMLHPFYDNNNGQAKVIATTKTDIQGKYSFDNVEPGIYSFHTMFSLGNGGACNVFDLSKIIKIEASRLATVNLSLTCNP